MLRRRTKRKLLLVLFVFTLIFSVAVSDSGAFGGGRKWGWCRWWPCDD